MPNLIDLGSNSLKNGDIFDDAFLTMVSSPIATMTGYGATIGFGILWAWILSSTYLPAVIHLKKWNMQNTAISKPSILENLIHRFGRSILEYPKRILATGVVIVVVSSIGVIFAETA